MQNQLAATRGQGQAMPETVRRSMENRFGADFSGVRLHTGSAASQLSSSIQAHAFTHGSDIYFNKGQYNPGAHAGQRLLAHELTHVVQQGGAGQPAIQRAFGKSKRKKRTQPQADAELSETGAAPQDALFIVKAAIKTGTKTRGRASMQEILAGGGGHGWLEIELGPAYQSLDAFEQNAVDGDVVSQAMDATTRAELAAHRDTSLGFYPDVQGATSKSNLAKQLFADLPGHIVQPEQPSFLGSARGSKAFAITDSTEALQLLAFINSHRQHPYHVMRYNCTDFVIGALAAMGRSIGNTKNSLGWTVPTKLYKRIYERSVTGDKGASHTNLDTKLNRAGKQMDVKHVSKKASKRLKKEAGKVAAAQAVTQAQELEQRVIVEYVVQGFLPIRSGGMLRPGTVIGVTGEIDGEYGQISTNGSAIWVALDTFEQTFGEPYPGAKSKRQGEQPGVDETKDDITAQDINVAEYEADL